MRAIISGIGHYAPERKLHNADLEKMVQTSDEWISTRTGIKSRRILEKNKPTSYMAVKASRKALAIAGKSPDEIDLIIVATVSPDMPVPATAAFVQNEIGATNCWGYDLNGGCTGFMYALATGAQFIETGVHKNILVIGADKMSAIVNYEDRNTCVLFGDAAGAVVLSPSPDGSNYGIEDFLLRLAGKGATSLYIEAGGSLHPATHQTVEKNMHFVYQDGRIVFKQAVVGMTDMIQKILNRNGLTSEDIQLFIPHQANYRIIDAVAKKVGLPPEKVIININEYGNTTAATIPLAMSEAYHDKRMAPGDRIILSAFGAGFTWGSLIFKWAID